MEEQIIFGIDSAVFMDGYKVKEEDAKIKLKEDDAYKYLWITNLLSEDKKDFFPFASKDMKEWRICFGAFRHGKKVDLEYLINNFENIKKLSKIC